MVVRHRRKLRNCTKMRYDYERLFKSRNEEDNKIEREKTFNDQSSKIIKMSKQKVEIEKKMFMQLRRKCRSYVKR